MQTRLSSSGWSMNNCIQLSRAWSVIIIVYSAMREKYFSVMVTFVWHIHWRLMDAIFKCLVLVLLVVLPLNMMALLYKSLLQAHMHIKYAQNVFNIKVGIYKKGLAKAIHLSCTWDTNHFDYWWHNRFFEGI